MRKNKNQLLAIGCIVAALLGITVVLQVSTWWTQTPAPNINPLVGLVQIILGRVKIPLFTWILLIFLVMVAAAIYLKFSEPSHAFSGRGHMVKYSDVKDRLGQEQAVKAARTTLAATYTPMSADPATARAMAEDYASKIPADMLVTRLGKLNGHNIFSQSEDSKLVIAPPREGKTNLLAVELVLDAPGAVLATSTKVDLLYASIVSRQRQGKVFVLDFENISAWPELVRWNPVVGCDDFETALRRGQAWVGAQPIKGATNADFFNSRAAQILGRLLHVAAISGGSIREVARWAGNLQGTELDNVLEDYRDKLEDGVAEFLRADITSTAGETIDSVRQTIAGLLEPVATARVRDFLPPPKGEEFNIEQFLMGQNTLYLVCDEEIGVDTSPIVSMFAAEVYNTARRLSQEAGGRFWPAVRFVLDELATTAALPKMEKIMADSGGRGIEIWAFVQTLSQLHHRWGKDNGDTIYGAANVKFFLPGLDYDTVKPISDLIGTYQKKRMSYTQQYGGYNNSWSGRSGGSSSSSTEEKPILEPRDITKLKSRHAIVAYRNMTPMELILTPWWEREDHEQLYADRVKAFETAGKIPQFVSPKD